MSEEIQNHILQRYTIIQKLGRGAYGYVWKIQQKKTKKIYALKKIFDAFQHSTDAQRTYRQIFYLQQLNHQNIIKLYQVIRAQNNKDIYLIFQYMNVDLFLVIKQNLLNSTHKKFIIYQIAKALKYIHSADIIHRDLKPSNILLNSECQAKVCDFGLVRSINQVQLNDSILTQYIATRWYRAPQIVLGSNKYSKAIDIWSFGCIIGQMYKGTALFAGTSTLNQLQKILSWTGVPKIEDIQQLGQNCSFSLIQQLKGVKERSMLQYLPDEDLMNFLKNILQFNPKKRMTIEQILQHPFLSDFHQPLQEIRCTKVMRCKINDNRKLNVKDYRQLIYNQIEQKANKNSDIKKLNNLSLTYKKSIIQKNIRETKTKSFERQINNGRTLLFEGQSQEYNSIKNLKNITMQYKIRRSNEKLKTQVDERFKNKRKIINCMQIKKNVRLNNIIQDSKSANNDKYLIYSKDRKHIYKRYMGKRQHQI